MEFSDGTLKVELENNEGSKLQKLKGYDDKFLHEWKSPDPFKNWGKDSRKDLTGADSIESTTTYIVPELPNLEKGSTIEICSEDGRKQIGEILEVLTNVQKLPAKPLPLKLTSRVAKRQIHALDPSRPAFVCAIHEDNIVIDCRYCRIASGYKKKSTTNSGNKVLVTTPKQKSIFPAKDTSGNIPRTLSDTNPSEKRQICTMNRTIAPVRYAQKFRPEWLAMKEFKGWLTEAKITPDSDSCAQCKYCSVFLVNNENNLARHAITNKHMKNVETQNGEMLEDLLKRPLDDSIDEMANKEEMFGKYVASEMKRIKNKKTYEEVKWKILKALHTAVEMESEADKTSD